MRSCRACCADDTFRTAPCECGSSDDDAPSGDAGAVDVDEDASPISRDAHGAENAFCELAVPPVQSRTDRLRRVALSPSLDDASSSSPSRMV